jgi:hypothetical protein
MLKEKIASEEVKREYNLRNYSPSKLGALQKCYTYYTVQDQVRAWGIM